jgi:hypothetical protein
LLPAQLARTRPPLAQGLEQVTGLEQPFLGPVPRQVLLPQEQEQGQEQGQEMLLVRQLPLGLPEQMPLERQPHQPIQA